ncbi:acyl-CoA N-acyltransferase [Coniella lustricola]|uniref:Acyl-CoA N-acyltransferase n=1 Tax=Coniella lustricola TaxID=2025994 RepID=A0A2T3A4B3_9PEZI|nr:acyl-CoA N-acyltransferase [Coniella lustricola]
MSSSSSPALKLRRGQESDVEAMVDIFLDAFSGNTVGRTLFPRDKTSARAFWRKALSEEIHDPNAHFLVITDTATTSGMNDQETSIIAFAKWVNPLPHDAPAMPIPSEDEWPAEGNPKLAMVFFQKLADMHHSIMQNRRHWYLELIATRTAYQGRGAGAMMMTWGVQRADADCVECYLDATPDGKPLYGKWGFEDVDTCRFFDDVYIHSFMVRMVRGGKDGGGGGGGG